MKIIITMNSNYAIYEQIVNQIRDAIINHELQPEEAMPSIRSLAKDLEVSVITTKRAYEELEKQNLIQSVAGKGFYVCEQNMELLKEKQRMMLEKECSDLVNACKNAGISLEELTGMITVFYENE
jgi:GntR family transcriptional regulator